MIGNIWEWTADDFQPYPGFIIDPYKEYSKPWFGTHKVLRGGCWATSSLLIRLLEKLLDPDRARGSGRVPHLCEENRRHENTARHDCAAGPHQGMNITGAALGCISSRKSCYWVRVTQNYDGKNLAMVLIAFDARRSADSIRHFDEGISR